MQKSSIFIDNAWKCKCDCYRIPFGSCSRHATSSNSIIIVAFVICFHRFVTVVFLFHSFGWIAPVFRINVMPTKTQFQRAEVILYCYIPIRTQYQSNDCLPLKNRFGCRIKSPHNHIDVLRFSSDLVEHNFFLFLRYSILPFWAKSLLILFKRKSTKDSNERIGRENLQRIRC